MNDIKISVIIPVYNVEKYLKECLDSIINQTLKEIEIICIDDCSTDNSYKILEEYAKKDNRIKILQNEKNTGGPSTARNKGIKISKGEYIYFIDADDYIENIFLEEMYNTAKKYNTDVVTNLNIIEDENGNLNYFRKNIYNFINTKEMGNKEVLEGKSDISMRNLKDDTKEFPYLVVWNKIYRRNSIIQNNINFLPYTEGKDYCAEDDHFTFQILLHRLTFSYNHRAKYFYRKISSSLSNTKISMASYYFRANNLIDSFKSHEHIDFLYKRIIEGLYWHFKNHIMNNTKINNINKEYYYLYDIANKIYLKKEVFGTSDYFNFIIIKSNDTYEKYLLNKELFDKLNNFNSKINELYKKIDSVNNRINELNNTLNPLIKKLDKKIKIFGIDKFDDKKIIYIFGIKITIKK